MLPKEPRNDYACGSAAKCELKTELVCYEDLAQGDRLVPTDDANRGCWPEGESREVQVSLTLGAYVYCANGTHFLDAEARNDDGTFRGLRRLTEG